MHSGSIVAVVLILGSVSGFGGAFVAVQAFSDDLTGATGSRGETGRMGPIGPRGPTGPTAPTPFGSVTLVGPFGRCPVGSSNLGEVIIEGNPYTNIQACSDPW